MNRADTPILPLAFRDVSIDAGGVRLIDALSFEIGAGPRTIILGPNGAGKSLVLRLAHGLVQPTSGGVHWHDPAAARTPGLCGMVFSRPSLLRRTVTANLRYALALAGIKGSDADLRTAAALALTGLEGLARRRAGTLSTGEQQRLAIARAWAPAPQVLLLDEPTANLDPAAADAVEAIIRDISSDGIKVIMTTHDLPLARRLGEDILLLHRGSLIERAAAESFFSAPGTEIARKFVAGQLTW